MAIAHRSILLASPIRLQTYSTYDTPGYPVGVFNLNGTFLGFAANQAQYVTVWNADPVNAAAGTISAGPTPLTFNCTNILPGKLIGLRYWQVDTTRRVSILVGDNSLVYWGTGQPVASNTLGTLRGAGIQSSFSLSLNRMMQSQNNFQIRQINRDYVTPGNYTVTVFHSETDIAAGQNCLGFFGGSGDGEATNLRGNLPIELWDFEGLSDNAFTSNNNNYKTNITNWSEVKGLKIIGFNTNGDLTNNIATKMPSLANWKSTLTGIGVGGNRGGAGPTELNLDPSYTKLDFLLFEYNTTSTPFFSGNNFPLFRTGFALNNNSTLTAADMDTFFNNIVANSGYNTIVTGNSWYFGYPRIRIGGKFTSASLAARTTLAARGYVFN